MISSLFRLVLVAGAALALTGCASDRDGGRSYVGASIGYSGPYYGWYDNYYYPGVGNYVYERSGTRHRWTRDQRHYWEARRPHNGAAENWSAYGRSRPYQNDERRHNR